MNFLKPNISKKTKLLIFCILLFLSIIYIGIFGFINYNKNIEIVSNPEYAIGIIENFSKATTGVRIRGRSAFVQFKYNILNKKFIKDNGFYESNIPNEGPKPGDKFMVIYLKTNPQQSRMLFNYPIKDSSDFKRYLNELKINPPKPWSFLFFLRDY